MYQINKVKASNCINVYNSLLKGASKYLLKIWSKKEMNEPEMVFENSTENKCDIIGSIEEPTSLKTIDSNDIFCKGWFYSKNGIKLIDVYLDRRKIGNIVLGVQRPDLNYTFPQYSKIEESGFYFYKHISVSDGKHTIKIKVINKNNEKKCFTKDIIVNKNISSIERINIELTNHCNLTCRWCVGTGNRPKGFMDYDLFTSIFNEINSNELLINEIHIYNVGETLLHPDFFKIIKYIGKFSKRPKIVLVTNATLLTEHIIHQIITSNGIDLIQFSIDGGTKESFEWLRNGANWDNTLKKVDLFLNENQGKIKTGLITIDMDVKFSEEFEKIVKKVDFFDFRSPHNWTGKDELEGYPFNKKFNPYPCWFVSRNMVILWNGDVTSCCADLHGRGIFGNIKNNNLNNLWKSGRLNVFRLQGLGRKKEIELCENCSIP